MSGEPTPPELPPPDTPRPARSRWWLAGVGVFVGLAIAAGGTLVYFASAGKRERLQIADCREGNVPNAYIRLVLERSPGFDPQRLGLPAPERVLPILSCQEGADAGRPVRLRPEQERRYLRLFTHGRLPVVRRGRVVGSEPFPAPPR